MSPQTAAQSLGLSTRAANQSWRSFLALEQMSDDEEFGEHVEPNLYSYFEEVFKTANVRDWLVWSDEQRKFTNEEGVRELYQWILGEPLENGEFGDPKLPEAKSVRQLGKIIGDAGAMAAFTSEGGSLTRALARFESEHPQEWVPSIINAQAVLASLSPDNLRALTESEILKLNALRDRVSQVLEDWRCLTEGVANG